VKYIARGTVDPAKAKKALALSEEKYCSISATLRPVVDLTFEIEVEAEGASAEE
jgi:putative redox protein